MPEAVWGDLHVSEPGRRSSGFCGPLELTKGRMMLRMEESRAVSSFLGIQELLRNKVDSVDEIIAKITAVTREDIKRAANCVIKSENLVLSIVGPFDDASHFEDMLTFD